MSIATRGVNVLEAYDWYRSGKLRVNRRYQRKLVWTVEEKQKLIESILLGYPLPLIFLAENNGLYEIIDGMQRLNAVFSFIETSYPIEEKYFDFEECPTAKLEVSKGSLEVRDLSPSEKLSREKCAKILNYQLAVTEFSAKEESKVNEIFSRINSSGRQLSNQEKRQAGVVSDFADLVRELSAEIRGDVSYKSLKLVDMPVISIDTKKETHGYKIKAEETFWCRHGILSTKQLRQSEDEDMIADISASLLLDSPLAKSKENLDALYNEEKKEAQDINKKLRKHGIERLKEEIKLVFDLIDKTVKGHTSKPLAFRKTVMGTSTTASSAKAPFYTLFIAFYELVIEESKYPDKSKKIMSALSQINKKLEKATHHATVGQREKNINTVKGLIQRYFVKKEPRQLTHGQGLSLDLENSFRRSKLETSHYEFKQGFLKLESKRKFDKNLIEKIAQTACGMANIHPKKEGFIHIGVADQKATAEKIKKIDSISPKKTDGFYVVGVEREAKQEKKTLEKYVDYFVSQFKQTALSEPLKSSILKNMDIIDYHGFSIIRLKIPSQNRVSYVNGQCFIREHSHTKAIQGREAEDIIRLFDQLKNNG